MNKAPQVTVKYAFCCSGSTKYCDCVNKNHGTAFMGANEPGDDYVIVPTPSPSAAINAVKALLTAVNASVKPKDEPNRVFLKNGEVVTGEMADRWLEFMRLIKETCETALAIEDQGKAIELTWEQALKKAVAECHLITARDPKDMEHAQFYQGARAVVDTLDMYVKKTEDMIGYSIPDGWSATPERYTKYPLYVEYNGTAWALGNHNFQGRHRVLGEFGTARLALDAAKTLTPKGTLPK